MSSHRSVPLWPQLEGILSAYIESRGLLPEPSRALFPSSRGDGHLVDLRKALDRASAAIGWQPGSIRPYAFRHTYCAARLQTLDAGAPVSPFTVARELGHGGLSLVNRVYGHLGEVRHRSPVVEFLVAQHKHRLGPSLRLLNWRDAS